MQSATALAPPIDAIGEHSGRCDRRRMTSAAALLQDAPVVPVSLESGADRDPATSCEPGFSERLTAERAAMRSGGLLTAAPGRRFPEGIATTDRARYPRPTDRIGPGVRSAARMIAGLSVNEAERMALPLLAADGGMDSEPETASIP